MAKLQELGPDLQYRPEASLKGSKQTSGTGRCWTLLDMAVQKVNSKKRKVEAGISLRSQVRNVKGPELELRLGSDTGKERGHCASQTLTEHTHSASFHIPL